jgi:predicted membrane protein
MDEERARILKMLEDGKISASEAEKLLLALKGQPRPDAISSDELRVRMRRLGLREMRRMPEVVGSVIKEAVEDGLNAAVRKQRFEFESKGKLLVRNVSGDTEIEAWDKSTILFDRDEGGLWKANEREGMIMAKVLSGDLRVKVPRRTSLNVNSVSGDILVRGVNGKLETKSVSGDIELRDISEAVDVSTNSGDIKTRDIEGKCHITTVSGDVDLGFRKDLAGLVETRSGNIEVWVPSDANVSLEAEIVLDGEIHNEVEVKSEHIDEKPHHLRLAFGKHENHLWVRCRNGDIKVHSYVPESGKPKAATEKPEAEEEK